MKPPISVVNVRNLFELCGGSEATREKLAGKPLNYKGIYSYFHCGQCLIESAEKQEPVESKLEVGWTPKGLQVWCKIHDVNITHIDFEKHTHPASITAAQGRIFTATHQKSLADLMEKLRLVWILRQQPG